ncbi:MAG TPA: PIN domain-containing protein [Solirubrobacteraceae bacterium]|nr:PIN domain-containing protein [Solirubrobacteraceae bacterium]
MLLWHLSDDPRLGPKATAAIEAAMLPHHHGDPFDRLLIAQAQAHSLPIVTGNPAFGDYDVRVIWD